MKIMMLISLLMLLIMTSSCSNDSETHERVYNYVEFQKKCKIVGDFLGSTRTVSLHENFKDFKCSIVIPSVDITRQEKIIRELYDEHLVNWIFKLSN